MTFVTALKNRSVVGNWPSQILNANIRKNIHRMYTGVKTKHVLCNDIFTTTSFHGTAFLKLKTLFIYYTKEYVQAIVIIIKMLIESVCTTNNGCLKRLDLSS